MADVALRDDDALKMFQPEKHHLACKSVSRGLT